MARPVSSKFTPSAKAEEKSGKWYLIDLNGKILGRVASRMATILRGKHRVDFTPHLDHGDHIVAINAEKIKITGKKDSDKLYYSHSGYPGGIRSIKAKKMMEAHPDRLIIKAVQGMLPKGPLGRKLLKKLKVYKGSDHPHCAQKPESLNI